MGLGDVRACEQLDVRLDLGELWLGGIIDHASSHNAAFSSLLSGAGSINSSSTSPSSRPARIHVLTAVCRESNSPTIDSWLARLPVGVAERFRTMRRFSVRAA